MEGTTIPTDIMLTRISPEAVSGPKFVEKRDPFVQLAKEAST